jgi:hypothetical protein
MTDVGCKWCLNNARFGATVLILMIVFPADAADNKPFGPQNFFDSCVIR